jgi:hypothetical protein
MSQNLNPSNSLPSNAEELFVVTREMVAGLTIHEKAIGVVHNTAATVGQELAAAEDAFRIYDALKKERANVLSPAMQKANDEAKSYIGVAKDVLRLYLGKHWTEQWAEAGFVSRSLRDPVSLDGREAVLKALAAYFKAHPAQQSKDPEVNAVRAAKLLTNLSAARAAVKNHPARQRASRIAQEKAISVLRNRLRATFGELNLRLERDSVIWGAFGLTAPALIGRRRVKKDEAPTDASSPAREKTSAPAKSTVALAV